MKICSVIFHARARTVWPFLTWIRLRSLCWTCGNVSLQTWILSFSLCVWVWINGLFYFTTCKQHKAQCSTDKNSSAFNVLYGFRKWNVYSYPRLENTSNLVFFTLHISPENPIGIVRCTWNVQHMESTYVLRRRAPSTPICQVYIHSTSLIIVALALHAINWHLIRGNVDSFNGLVFCCFFFRILSICFIFDDVSWNWSKCKPIFRWKIHEKIMFDFCIGQRWMVYNWRPTTWKY